MSFIECILFDMQINYRNIAFNSVVYNYFGKFVSAIFSFLAFTYAARSISIEDYGLYGIILNAILFIFILLEFGITELILRFLPEYVEKKDLFTVRWLLNRCILFVLASSLLLGLLLAVAQVALPSYVKIAIHLNFNLSFLVIFGSLRVLLHVAGNTLNSFFLQGYRNICEVISSIFKLALFYLSIKWGYGVLGLIVSYGLTDLLSISLYFVKLYKPLYCQAHQQPKNINIPVYRFFKFGLNEYLYKLFWFFTDNRLDIYIVSGFLGITATGHYSFAINIANLMIEWSPGLVIRSVVSPLFVKQYTKNKKISELEYLFQLHNKFLIFLTLPVFLFVGVLAKEIITHIFDPKFIPALSGLLIFIFFMFSYNILIPVRNILAVLERTDICKYSNLIAIFKFLLIFPLIKFYGINGAAIAYGVSLWMILVFHLIMTRKFFNLVYPWKSIIKISINGLIAGFGIYLIKGNISGIASLFFVILAGVIIYIVLSLYNKPFNDYDRELLNKGFKIPIWRF